jgi:regulation of enolase protein 1 (concanavalin A-like superfamily)
MGASNGFTIWAAGTDIWNQSDEFRFVYRALTGDGVIIARVQNLYPGEPWSKAGLMIRESLSPGSKHASIFRSGTQGLAFQHRGVTNDWTNHDAGIGDFGTTWIKLERQGSTFTGSYSWDGVNWGTVGQIGLSMSGSVYVGLALTSHSEAYASVDFTNVSATGSSGSQSGWTSTDVGEPVLTGSTSTIANGLALTAGGADVWGTWDQFRFAYQQMTGDGSIVALVGGLSAADAYTKAGVMIRDTLSPSSPHAYMLLTGTQGAFFQRRKTVGGGSLSTPGPSSGAPLWVRLQRQGTTITGSYSWDGVNWATAGSDTIAMGSTVYVGLAATSHSWVAYATANFLSASIGSIGGGGGSPGPGPGPGNQSPSVTLTSPGFGASFSAPAAIPLTATASDPDGYVTAVEFYWGPYLLGSATSSPYSMTWYGIPNGSYSLTAVARDNAGGMTVSSERVVSVGTGAQSAVFVPSSNQATAVNHYVLDVFPVGADPNTVNSIASLDLGIPPVVNGESRADITAFVAGLPPGNYFATVTAVGSGGATQSAPSPQFSH